MQAEEVLKEALAKSPSNIPVQLKLANIYANRKDLNGFTNIARKLKDSGDAQAWAEVAALGRAIDSSNPMYEGAGEAAGEAIVEPPKPGAMPALDMDIGFNIPMDLDVTTAMHAAEPGAPAMDFDVSGVTVPATDLDVTGGHAAEPEALLPDFDVTGGHPSTLGVEHMQFDVTASHPNVAEPLSMDFDVTGSHPNVTEALHMDFDVTSSHPALTEPLAMDFDVTGSHPGVLAASLAPDETMSMLSSPMDFDISAKLGEVSAAAELAPSLGATDFEISAPMPASSPAAAEALPSFGGMDFDISAPTPVASPAVAEVPASFGGMDFDLSAPTPTPSAPPAEVPSSFGGMDFDISSAPSAPGAKAEPAMDLGLSGISLDLGKADTVVFPAAEAKKDERWQDVENKLDLATAFKEMGNPDNARELLGEVLNEGDEQQIAAARTLMEQL